MTPQYKLVVVTPFNDFQRGHTILDQDLVNAILDVNNEMHALEANVRRVTLNADEIAHLSQVAAPAAEEVLSLNSINDQQETEKKPAKNKSAKE